MKSKQISAIILASIVFFSGCSKYTISNDILNNNKSSNEEISDPMQVPVETNTEIIAAAAYGLTFGVDDMIFSEDEFLVSPVLTDSDSPTNAGLMVFIDGVPQKYSIGNVSKKQFNTNFYIEALSEKSHNLNVNAIIDNDLENHFISVVSLLAPEFTPPVEAPNFGIYHRMLTPLSIQIPNEINNVSFAKNYNILSENNSKNLD